MSTGQQHKATVADQVTSECANRILTGVWPAGTAIPSESTLAEEFGVSRPALREALSRLSQARLLISRQGGPTMVRQWTKHAGLDVLGQIITAHRSEDQQITNSIFDLRALIYSDAARLSALRRSDKGAQDIRAIADELIADPQPTLAHHVPSSPFWSAVCRESGSITYVLTLNSLNETSALATEGSPILRTPYDPSIFGLIADAILAQDSEKAQALGKQVAEAARAFWLEIKASGEMSTNPDEKD